MLGKPIINPVKISKLLKFTDLDLALKFSQDSAITRAWLIDQQKTRNYIQPEELRALVSRNLTEAAERLKNCKRGWTNNQIN